jgi:hypothetical protein
MAESASRRQSYAKRILHVGIAALIVYLIVAYVLMPRLWQRFLRKHPNFDDTPGITHTGAGIPGDPINVVLIGSKDDMLRIMKAAQWTEAAGLGVRADLKIAVDSVLNRPDPNAPVSSLYLFGRKEDLAFEQEVGDNPRHRHHVRFWLAPNVDPSGRPIWVGSAVYDEHVGISRTTGQITHVTAPNVDAERDYLFQCLAKTNDLAEQYAVDDFHKIREGKNGGGDPWRTDGRLFVGVIKADQRP